MKEGLSFVDQYPIFQSHFKHPTGAFPDPDYAWFSFLCYYYCTLYTSILMHLFISSMFIEYLSYTKGLPRWLSGKEYTCPCWRCGFNPPLEEEMVTHFNILAWEIPWTEETGGKQSMDPKELDTSKWLINNNNHILIKGYRFIQALQRPALANSSEVAPSTLNHCLSPQSNSFPS